VGLALNGKRCVFELAPALLLPQLLLTMMLVRLDLVRQWNVRVEAQLGYRNQVCTFCVGAADIQAADNASEVPGIMNVNDIASVRNGNVGRLICHCACQLPGNVRLNRQRTFQEWHEHGNFFGSSIINVLPSRGGFDAISLCCSLCARKGR